MTREQTRGFRLRSPRIQFELHVLKSILILSAMHASTAPAFSFFRGHPPKKRDPDKQRCLKLPGVRISARASDRLPRVPGRSLLKVLAPTYRRQSGCSVRSQVLRREVSSAAAIK